MNYPYPQETKFSQFLRHGGSGEFVVRLKPRRFEQKSHHDFEATLVQFHDALQAQATRIFEQMKNTFEKYAPDKIANFDFDPKAQIGATFAEFNEALENDPSQVKQMGAWARRFGAELNREFQEDLGISQYIWRSRDDGKVRGDHADYDDQIFSWNAPPKGGHPGESYNCRCWAEPYLSEAQIATTELATDQLGGEFACEGLRACWLIDTDLLGSGDWTTSDRVLHLQKWQDANRYNLSRADGYLKYVTENDLMTLKIRASFYSWAQSELAQKGHEVKWPGAAGEAVEGAWYLYGIKGSDPEMVAMIMGANDWIIKDVWSKLSAINSQENIFTGDEAKLWDMKMLAAEQRLVQPIYDEYGDSEAMASYEEHVKHELWYTSETINAAGGVSLPKFEGNIRNPIDRWLFGMSAMGYEGVEGSQMPKEETNQ